MYELLMNFQRVRCIGPISAHRYNCDELKYVFEWSQQSAESNSLNANSVHVSVKNVNLRSKNRGMHIRAFFHFL